jgi:hypothetical protein
LYCALIREPVLKEGWAALKKMAIERVAYRTGGGEGVMCMGWKGGGADNKCRMKNTRGLRWGGAGGMPVRLERQERHKEKQKNKNRPENAKGRRNVMES